jgi:uncharacterized protein YcaQ
MPLSIDTLRRYAVARSLFTPTTLEHALERLGFVQADPIRSPARAQDLTLGHRVAGYRAGDLERRYPSLPVSEDVFVNYGFVTSPLQALMHPRARTGAWSPARRRTADAVLAFIRERGAVHPREVDERFARGAVVNYWGGSSNATTHLLDIMHYRGMLRVVRREGGIRIYEACDHGPGPADAAERRVRLDALADVLVRVYAPLPARSLSAFIGRLRYAVPQWRADLKATLRRAHQRLSRGRAGDVDWYWPAGEPLDDGLPDGSVRLLAPFDPVVWDRRRFELFWGWAYRFEAYTPAPKRKLGYYALPLLWRDRIIGWGNLSVSEGVLHAGIGYVAGAPPRERAFGPALDAELDRMRTFLRLPQCIEESS